ncbi:GHMP kinase [Candidatus Geothermarchaeota archaeon ex4572_27]|nr:MAG: GHMP kinase [Candidatus Geothermarchaeota archaeon ex4572_27]
MDAVAVRAPAHLHAGNMDLSGDLGRLFGTVGFAIDIPVEVEVRRAEGVSANDRHAERFARALVGRYGLPGLAIRVLRRVPEYSGMGYLTTLALSIGIGASELYGLGLSIEELALSLGRGALTALGTYAVKLGGFIVEGGFRVGELGKRVPPLLFRGEVPGSWLFVIAVPEGPRKRIARMREEREGEILSRLKKMDPGLSSRLCRLVLMKMLPAFVERDLRAFAEALTEFNAALGDFWAEYQGGRYCDPLVEEGIRLLIDELGCGCQSSWGPAFYGITDDHERARRAAERLRRLLDGAGGGDVYLARASNRGAAVERLR